MSCFNASASSRSISVTPMMALRGVRRLVLGRAQLTPTKDRPKIGGRRTRLLPLGAPG
jgi:hypothetical protein